MLLRLFNVIAVFFWCCILTNVSCQAQVVTSTPSHVFVSGEMGFSCYRSPILVDIPEKALLFFAVGKHGPGCSDYHGKTVVVRRSLDHGKTWGEIIVVGNVSRPDTVELGDGINLGTAVYDPVTQTVWILWVECYHKCSVAGHMLTYSRDFGETWLETPRNITPAIRPVLGRFTPGPGYGLYLAEKERILMCGHFSNSSKTEDISESPEVKQAGFGDSLVGTGGAACVYSDDHGDTWSVGGIINATGVDATANECQPVELPTHDLLINARVRGSSARVQAFSETSGETWTNVTKIDDFHPGTECQGSLAVRAKSLFIDRHENEPTHTELFFSHPASSHTRTNMTVWRSEDEGQTWSWLVSVWHGPSAYSCLALLGNSTLALGFESGDTSLYQSISLVMIELDND